MPIVGPDDRALRDLPRHRRQAGHEPEGLPALPGPRRRVAGPGPVLDLPAVLALPRRRHDHRGPVPDLPRRGPAAHGQALPGRTSPRACGGQQDPARRQGRARPNGGPPGDLFVVTHVAELADLHAQGRQRRGRGAADDPRGAAGRRDRGPDAQRAQDAARPAGHEARHGPAPARRGPAEARRARAAATSTTASSSTSPRR